MSNLFAEFSSIHKQSLHGSDLSAIPEKYLNDRKLFDRFLPVLTEVKKRNLTTGVDFGCGVGAATVLGKLMGIKVVGIDIPYYKEISNPYCKVHENLISMGFNINIFDTSVYPWNFKDNVFQFLLGFCSIGKDNSPGSLKDKSTMHEAEWVNKRVSELMRISHRKSIWYLGPKSTITFVRKNESFKKRPKSITLKEWPL